MTFNFSIVTLTADGSVAIVLMEKPSDEVVLLECDRATAISLLRNLSSALELGGKW